MRKILFIVGSVLISGCATNSLPVKNTTIQQETRLSTLDPSVLQSSIAVEEKNGEDMFAHAKLVKLKNYKIIFSDASNKMYIIKGHDVVAGLDGDYMYIYNDPKAPLFGSESVIFGDNYIKYKGTDYVYEDYGLDGLNTLERKEYIDSNNGKQAAIPKRNGNVCKGTSFSRLACCHDKSKELKPFKFTSYSGWVPVEDDEDANKICKLVSRKFKPKARHPRSNKVAKRKLNIKRS